MRPFLEVRSLLPESGLEGSEISFKLIEVGLGRLCTAFLWDCSRLELRLSQGLSFNLGSRSDLAVRIDLSLMFSPGLRFRLEGFVASGLFRPPHRYSLVQWVRFWFSNRIR
ncbi:hypothetical protein F2Q69_00046281 [Brassica cretica]|uniref:Uncharacterized protein n=1 Tax=Brassica cretica TaxID=69181 RepID=A0A8S9PRK9_BRACR|nr:hypothetical protein F2Q69_00046281 [Brassica cretica]